MIKIVDRYIFRELLEPFLFGLGAFTAILSSSMVLFELVRAVVLKGMPLKITARTRSNMSMLEARIAVKAPKPKRKGSRSSRKM